jgi:hypothetical protein
MTSSRLLQANAVDDAGHDEVAGHFGNPAECGVANDVGGTIDRDSADQGDRSSFGAACSRDVAYGFSLIVRSMTVELMNLAKQSSRSRP